MRLTTIAMGMVLLCGQACFGAYQFTVTGAVSGITGEPLPGVNVGDTMVATVAYDPATFADGVNVSGDGLDYAAPAGLAMSYSFTSGGLYTNDIICVRARVNGSCDQWNWKGGPGGLLFQLNGSSDAAWDETPPSSFADVHNLFQSCRSDFSLGSPAGVRLTGDDAYGVRNLTISLTSWSDIRASSTVPAPAAVLLGGLGAGLVDWLRRRRSL